MNLEIINKRNIGTKKETLLFVHGVCHGAWTWTNFMDYFSARGYDCYAMSLRGHCKSEGKENLNNFSLDDYVQDVLQVLAPFEGNAIVIGHSMGGGIVQKLIGEHPGHVKAAILFASIPPCGMDEQVANDMIARAPKGAYDLLKLAKGEPLTIDEVFECPLFGGRIPMEQLEKYYTYLQPESETAQNSLYSNITDCYDNVTIPVGVIGSSNDLIFADREQQLVANAYHTTAVLLKDLCHDMMLDPDWEKAAAAVLDFIENLTI